MSFPVGSVRDYRPKEKPDYQKITGLNLIPANELLKYKLPKSLFGGYKTYINYKFIHPEWNIWNCGYQLPDEFRTRMFDVFMSISIQQKNIERTANIFEYALLNLKTTLENFMVTNIDDMFENVKRDWSSGLTDDEFNAIIRAGIIIKMYKATRAHPINETLMNYLLDQYDRYGYDSHSKKKIGKLSLKNTDGVDIIEWYSKHIIRLNDKIDSIANVYIDAINKYYDDRDKKKLEREQQIAEDRRKQEAEKERKLQEIDAFRVFLSDYCDIRSEHVEMIMRSVPKGTNCKTIYNVTNEFLNKYVPVACIKNITEALSGIPNKQGQCPLCFIYGAGGPSCRTHGVYKLSKRDDKCSICMANTIEVTVRCNHEFCKPCIDEWLTSNSTCPVCRAGLN